MMSDWLYQISSYAEFLPILIALFHLKYLEKGLKWYLGGMIMASIYGLISIKLGENGINNHFMIYINAATNFIFRTFFFIYIFNSVWSKRLVVSSLIVYLSGICVDIAVHGIYMNQYLFGVSDLLMTVFLILALSQILKDDKVESLRNYPLFWIVLGTLIYVIFDFLLAVANGWLYTVNRQFFFILWDYITPVFGFIKIALLCVGFWKTKKYYASLVV
jgi:hypothetical protein